MKPTAQQISAMIREYQKNDFAPVTFTVIDCRDPRTVTTVAPFRRDSELAYYEEQGFSCVVRENRGDFMASISRVVELTRKQAQALTFRSYGAAAAFVRDNYAELAAARTAFYGA